MLRRSSPDKKPPSTGTPAWEKTRPRRKTRLSAEAPEFFPENTNTNVAEAEVDNLASTPVDDSPQSVRHDLSKSPEEPHQNDSEEETTSPESNLERSNSQMLSFDQQSFNSDDLYTTNSRVWVAPKTAELERWQRTKSNLHRMSFIPKSPLLPRTFPDWLQHRMDYLDTQVEQLVKQIAIKEKERRKQIYPELNTIKAKKPFAERDFPDGRSSVLARKSIWSPWPDVTQRHEPAPWPSTQEMKEEGDERHTSGYGRFLALPRAPGNPTVNHKQRHIITAHALDRVWAVPPCGRQIVEEEEDYDDDYMRFLLGGELLEALDN